MMSAFYPAQANAGRIQSREQSALSPLLFF
jgi:hypothetical protein